MSNTRIQEILSLYSHIDEAELGEDKFDGHHSINQAEAELIAYFRELAGEELQPEHFLLSHYTTNPERILMDSLKYYRHEISSKLEGEGPSELDIKPI